MGGMAGPRDAWHNKGGSFKGGSGGGGGGGGGHRDRDRDYRRPDFHAGRKGGAGGGDGKGGAGGGGHGASSPQDASARKAEFDLPFQVKERTVSEHYSRHLHRMHVVPKNLARVAASWVDRPVASALPAALTRQHTLRFDTAAVFNGASPPEQQVEQRTPLEFAGDVVVAREERQAMLEAAKAGGDLSPQTPAVAEVRALIALRTAPEVADADAATPAEEAVERFVHPVKAVDLLVEKNLVGPAFFRAFGGEVEPAVLEAENGAAAEAALTGFVERGSGVRVERWFRLLELRYKSGRHVVFFCPEEMAGGTQVCPLPSFATVAGASPERRVVVQPAKVPLCNMLEHRLAGAGVPPETCELAFASDALYEYLKREAAARLPAALAACATRRAAAEAAQAARREVLEARRRVRRAERETLRGAREEEDAALQERWAAEVRGYTREEKAAITGAKTEAVQAARREEDGVAEEAFKVEMQGLEGGAEVGGGAVVRTLDHASYESLVFFDKEKQSGKGKAGAPGVVCVADRSQ